MDLELWEQCRGRDALYVWSDTSLFTMRFVGAPFTFSVRQVGTNCGLIGQSAAIVILMVHCCFGCQAKVDFLCTDGTVKTMILV